MNNKIIQLQGPFEAGMELLAEYLEDGTYLYAHRLGICSEVGNEFKINGQIFEIGKTGILEFSEVKIYSLSFEKGRTTTSLIDIILSEE